MSMSFDHGAPGGVLHVLVGLLACCDSAAINGAHACTCWAPVWPEGDRGQADPDLSLPEHARGSMCADCAYRPDSPERTGSPTVDGDSELLERIVARGEPFYCHDGMRVPRAWRHPAGVEVTVPPTGYQPARVHDGGRERLFRADGSPALLCAGWSARRRLLVAAADQVVAELADSQGDGS